MEVDLVLGILQAAGNICERNPLPHSECNYRVLRNGSEGEETFLLDCEDRMLSPWIRVNEAVKRRQSRSSIAGLAIAANSTMAEEWSSQRRD